jgi:hypothetical protein
MKVIAQINENTVLCEVAVNEIGRLHGVSGRYDSAWNKVWVSVGAEHDMTSAFAAVDTLRGFDAAQFRYVKQRIDDMSDQFEKVKTAYEKLTLFDKLSKPEDLTE